MRHGEVNIKYWTPEHFQRLLDEHHVTALECYFLEPDFHYSENIVHPPEPWKFELDKAKLYESLIEKADRDWVKAERWLSASHKTPENIRKAKKAIWHAFRILSFGSQIVDSRKIYYDEANWAHQSIMNDPAEDWEHYETKWRTDYNTFKKGLRAATIGTE